MPVCVSELRYVGHADLAKDLDNFTAALAGVSVAGAYLPANTPGTIEHWMLNEYYKSDEAFVFAIADAMHEEYQAIVDAGFLLQIDDPDLPDGWNCLPDITLPEYRRYAAMRVDALNHALKGIPPEKVRLHVCWGSHHGPHHDDIPLKDIIDLIFRVNAGSFSIEASNPCHEHEWRVFEEAKLPEGATLIPASSATAPISSNTRTWWPSDWFAMRSWWDARTCWPARTAELARGSAIRRSAGQSSRRWPRALDGQQRYCGAATELCHFQSIGKSEAIAD